MAKTDPTFNLSALADRLFAEKRLLTLAGKIRRAVDVHSLRTDLLMALECLDSLDLLRGQAGADGIGNLRQITEASLLYNAIILYVRATKTRSDERRPYDLLPKYTREQRMIHQELCDLRDKAIAHFGAGGSYTGEWKAEIAILQYSDDNIRVGVVTRRLTTDLGLVARLRPQISAALSLIQSAYDEKNGELIAAIDAAVGEDATFLREIIRHRVNLDIFMKSAVAADAIREGFSKGSLPGSA